MSDPTLFDPPAPQMPMKYDRALPWGVVEPLARKFYDEKPAMVPFQKVPMSWDVARGFGVTSWVRAVRRAEADIAGQLSLNSLPKGDQS